MRQEPPVELWLLGLDHSCPPVEMLAALRKVVKRLSLSRMMRSRRITEDVRQAPPFAVIEGFEADVLSSNGFLDDLRAVRLFGAKAEIRLRYDMGHWLAGGISEMDPGELPEPWLVSRDTYASLKSVTPWSFDGANPLPVVVKRYVSADGLRLLVQQAAHETN